MMLVLSWQLTILAVLLLMVLLRLVKVIGGKSANFFIKQLRALGQVNGYIEEMYSGHDVVRISRANDRNKETFRGMNRAVYEANRKSQFLSGIMQPLMNVIGNLGYVAVCVLGAALVMNGSIKFGLLTAFILYVRLFTSPLTTIAQGRTQLQSAAAAGDRVFDFLQEPELPDESKNLPAPQPVRGEIEFDHVRFSYPDHPEKTIIHDFSAHVAQGQKVAIVGPTGAGKTTMVNLLMRFYDLDGGDIRIDGISTKDMSREEVHGLFGMVLQDTWMFEGTMRENILFSKTGVSDERLKEICKEAGIWHYVRTLPGGLDYVLENEASVSGGQKQLITIARAMAENAPLLILDEATSNVDTRTEELIQKSMDKLAEGRTSFVIAHRLSTIKNADLILVMKDGNIIEQGTHDELIERTGFYAGLYNSQFAGE